MESIEPKKRRQVNSYTTQPLRSNSLNIKFNNPEEINSFILSMIESGSANQMELANLLGVSRQRIQQRLTKIKPDYRMGSSLKDPIKVLNAARTTYSWYTLSNELKVGTDTAKDILYALGKLEAVERLFKWRHEQRKKARKVKLLEKLKAAAEELGRTPTTQDMNARRAGLHPSATYQKYFKGVANAQKLAGLSFTKRGSKPKITSTREDVIADIQEVTKRLGRSPSHEEISTRTAGNKLPISHYLKHFSRYSEALKAAGVPYRTNPSKGRKGSGLTKEDAIKNLRKAASLKGATPSATDMIKKKYGLYSTTTYQKLFGSVTAAQDAAGLPRNFIDHRND